MARAGVDEGPGNQPQTLQGFAVGAQRDLVFGPALDVLEREARHAAPGNLAQVGDVERARQISAAERAALPGHARSATSGPR